MVCIPAFRRPKHLRATLESLAKQRRSIEVHRFIGRRHVKARVTESSCAVCFQVLAPVDLVNTSVTPTLGSANAIVEPVAVSVPADGVAWVRIGDCQASANDGSNGKCLRVPADRGYQVLVSDVGVPIVAQTLSRFGGGTGSAGATTSTGSTVPADHWIIPRTHAHADRSTSVSMTTPGLEAAHVSVEVVHNGQVQRPAALLGNASTQVKQNWETILRTVTESREKKS